MLCESLAHGFELGDAFGHVVGVDGDAVVDNEVKTVDNGNWKSKIRFDRLG